MMPAATQYSVTRFCWQSLLAAILAFLDVLGCTQPSVVEPHEDLTSESLGSTSTTVTTSSYVTSSDNPTSDPSTTSDEASATDTSDSPSTSTDDGETRVIDVALGSRHTCALLDQGAVKCWGNNDHGQLGLGDTAQRGDHRREMGKKLARAALGPSRVFVQIVAGEDHTCGRTTNNQVLCWGRNHRGQLGLGDLHNRGDDWRDLGDALPEVNLGAQAVDMTAGKHHTCALLVEGKMKCWGAHHSGQLGLGDTRDRGHEPREMGFNLPVVDLGKGRSIQHMIAGEGHTCALLGDGEVKCWGSNAFGQLGLGDGENRGILPGQMGNALPPVALGSLQRAVALTAGDYHTCAVLESGSVKCWGQNNRGQLGLGGIRNRGQFKHDMGDDLPAVTLAHRVVKSLSAGSHHTCAITDDDALLCWGRNDIGQLGLGDTDDRGDQVQEVEHLSAVALGKSDPTATRMVAGSNHNCALLILEIT